VDDFLNNVFRIVDAAVENYIDRSFTHLQVNFGCTGGQPLGFRRRRPRPPPQGKIRSEDRPAPCRTG
jgi:hypothetical protein